MSEDVAQDQNPKFVRVNSIYNVFEVASGYNQRQFHTSYANLYNWTSPWNLKLNLLQHTRSTVICGNIRQQIWLTCCCWFVPPYNAWINVFTGCMPPKTAWDRAQRRSEGELNFIRQSRVFKQWKRTKRSIQGPGYTTFHTFQKGRQKKGARTERTWYLTCKAADRCFSECCCRSFVISFQNTFKVNFVSKVTSRKNQIS